MQRDSQGENFRNATTARVTFVGSYIHVAVLDLVPMALPTFLKQLGRGDSPRCTCRSHNVPLAEYAF